MTKAEQIQRVLDHTVASLEGMERPVLLEITRALARAQDEVARELRVWLTKFKGSEKFTTQRHRAVLLQIRAALKRMQREGFQTADTALKKHARGIAGISMANLKREWATFSNIFEGSIQPIGIDEALVFAKGDAILWKQFESSAKKYGGRVGEQVRSELMVSRIRGESIYELTTRLEKSLPKVFKGDRADAARLARTETMNAYNEYHRQGIAEAHKDDPEVCKRWDGTADVRICPMCRSLDGQVRKVGEDYVAKWVSSSKKGIRNHIVIVRAAPAHPHCRCCETIWKEAWKVYEDSRQLAA